MKSISIVHTGYMVTADTTSSNVAFCNLMFVSHRATWAVLPWTVFIMSWMVFYRQMVNTNTTDTTITLETCGRGESQDGCKLSTLSPLQSSRIYSRDSGNTQTFNLNLTSFRNAFLTHYRLQLLK